MSTLNEKLLQDVLALPIESRTELVEKLLESLNPKSTSEIDTQWEQEIDRRIEEVEKGNVTLVPEEEVFKEILTWFKK